MEFADFAAGMREEAAKPGYKEALAAEELANRALWDNETKPTSEEVYEAVNVLQRACHVAAFQAGWWVKNGVDTRDNPLSFAQKLCLIHSEISEAMEGDRKNLMDDHLPWHFMRNVELGDAAIRIFDTAGGYGMDLASAIVEKMEYNAVRPDHKKEVREAEGGKSY